MSIVRAPRPQSNFYLLDKSISEDKRLSWAARGLLVYLLGKPDHWKVSPAALVNETRGAAKRTGRDGVYNLLAELQSAGYAQRRQVRLAGGQMGEVEYHISESPLPEMPYTAAPDTAEPHTAKPTQVSTEQKQVLKGKQGMKKGAAAPVLCPAGVSEQVWADFVEQRKTLKAPLTQTALDGIASQAAVAGWTLEAALSECCARGWRGFKAEWVREQSRPAAAAPRSTGKHAGFDSKNYREGVNDDGSF